MSEALLFLEGRDEPGAIQARVRVENMKTSDFQWAVEFSNRDEQIWWFPVATFKFKYQADAFVVHMNIIDPEAKYRLRDE